MRLGSFCHIKNKKPALSSYIVLYPNIEEVLQERNLHNNWLPSISSTPNIIPDKIKQKVFIKRTDEPFVLLSEFQDDNGSLYYQCLYNDSSGWIIGSQKNYEIITENKE